MIDITEDILMNFKEVQLVYSNDEVFTLKKENINIRSLSYTELNNKQLIDIKLNKFITKLELDISWKNIVETMKTNMSEYDTIERLKERLSCYYDISQLYLISETEEIGFCLGSLKHEYNINNPHQYNMLQDDKISILINIEGMYEPLNKNKRYMIRNKENYETETIKILRIEDTNDFKIYNIGKSTLSNKTFSSFRKAEEFLFNNDSFIVFDMQ